MLESIEQLAINLDELKSSDDEHKINKLYVFKSINKKIKADKMKKALKAKDNKGRNIFDGKKIVFTGKMVIRRSEVLELAQKYGAKTTNIVSKYTDVLVVGNRAGNKLNRAKDLGIKILLEEEFWNILDEAL